MPRLSSRETPLTLILIGANVLTFLLQYLSSHSWLVEGLALTRASPGRPWTLLTWPLLGLMGPIHLLCLSLWTWTVGGSLERAWGTIGWLKFLTITTLILTATILPILLLAPSDGAFAGIGMAMAPTTVAWCWINRDQTIRYQFLFPIPALAIAAITAGLSFYATGAALENPWAGFAGLSGCAYAWWWVRRGRDWWASKSATRGALPNPRFAELGRDIQGAKPSRNPFQKARDEKERQERDRKIAEMFRNSGYRDDD